MGKFVKFNSLNQFHEVVKNLNYPKIYNYLKTKKHKLQFDLKIKLHGTNACVRIESDGKVTAQKRSSDLGEGHDNYGFKSWVMSHESYFASLADSLFDVYIFGEWAGKGIQDDVAVSQIDKKFYVFTVDKYYDGEFAEREYGPDNIEMILGKKMPDDLIVIPIFKTIDIDFEAAIDTEKSIALLNVLSESIGECDPFIKEMFGVEGKGEGLVAYPKPDIHPTTYLNSGIEVFSWFNFKAKCKEHRVNKTKASVNFNPELFASANRLAEAFCTEQRFQQGLQEAVEGQFDYKLISTFIKWVCQDVQKESVTEINEAGLDWAKVSKVVSSRAAMWYRERVAKV